VKRAVFLGAAGKVTVNDFKLLSFMVPGVLSGFYLSIYAVDFVDRGNMGKALLSVSFLAGILVMVKAIIEYKRSSEKSWLVSGNSC
jgi:hypothetical protein